MKRAFDLCVSAGVLLIALPLLLLIAVAVWIDSGSPVLFRQERVGRGFHPFHVLKFRSMRSAKGANFTVSGDPRVTRVGKILRATKLDELPQFWNVLCGDMSVVGPRPEIPEYVGLYKERYERILGIRPGITDLASVRFRDEESVLAASTDPLAEYVEHILPLKLDLADEYVRRQCVKTDVLIVLQTVRALVRRRCAS